MTATTEPLMGVREVVDLFGMSERWLRQQVAERRLRHYKVGRRVLFRASDVESFIQSCARGGDR